MKIRFNPKEFLPKLRLVRNAVAVSKPTASLHNIKIVAKEIYFGAELQARNRELEIRVRVDCDVEQDGSVLVPANDLLTCWHWKKRSRWYWNVWTRVRC